MKIKHTNQLEIAQNEIWTSQKFPAIRYAISVHSHSQTMVAFHSGFRSAHHAPEDVEVDVRNNLKLLKLDYLDCLQVFYQNHVTLQHSTVTMSLMQVHPFTSFSTLSSDDMPAYDPERFAKTWQVCDVWLTTGGGWARLLLLQLNRTGIE